MTRLRLYLTWLYTATTSLILALALTSLFLLRIKETRQAKGQGIPGGVKLF